MKIFVLALCVGLASAGRLRVVRGVQSDVEAPIVRSEVDVRPDGYSYAYETGNGIAAEESGALKKFDAENEAINVQGQFKFNSPEGEPILVSYTADENGFHPQGSHLPVGPPTPEPILRALEYIAAHPPPVVDKKY